MVVLPVLIFCVALLKTCVGSEQTTVASESATENYACPGQCMKEEGCSLALNDTDCGSGLVCCIDQDGTTTTEYAEYFTTEDSFGYSSPAQEVYEEAEAEAEVQEVDQAGYSYMVGGEEKPEYTYIVPEESDDLTSRRSGDAAETCPGACIPVESSNECDYVLMNEDVCPPEAACCLTDEVIQATTDQYNYFITDEETSTDESEENVLVKRHIPSPSGGSCPGTCVHPSNALFCEQILPQFSCPLNSKCCIKRSTEQSSKIVQCTGQCLPLNMQGYCFPPNELILGSTTCKRGTTCCMQKSLGGRIQPPSVGAMQFPNVQYQMPPSDPSQVVLGHLAVDDEGTVFRVGTDGQISPLPRVSRIDHLRAKYNKLMVYPRSGGHIVIYSDSTGALYQQFYPNNTYDPETPFGRPSGQRPGKTPPVQRPKFKPIIKKPTEEESSLQDLEDIPIFQQEHETKKPIDTEKETSLQDFDAFPEQEPEDIIIPDDDDEAPVVESRPSIADSKTGRPTCPGSCLSYFLRFTCFRGYAIYDGFSCPGRSVCCARVADIESHEKRLRSLSPYYKESSDSGKTVPKCGIKGRKDSQRSVSGQESLPGEWCWQVAIINVQNQYMCGGALIGDSWVLTAAHCITSSMKENQAVFVRVGVTDLKSPEDNSKGQTIRVVSTFIHHNFNSINLDNNIALLKLQKPVDLTDNVCVVCLPTSGQMPAVNAKCTVTGYGFVSKEGEMSLKTGEAPVPIVDDTECMANVTEALVNPFILPASSFCAGGQGQQDACQGDAGGPLVCEIGGHHELVGLVSWTLGCGRSDVPSIYVKVPAFMGWINQVISSSSFLTAIN
ncbi:protein masquerade-like [Argiope bruennichi]|uniref:Protein masquerade like protein n=1 Tax=Argiope bruennichi TaxID=94029 RepID=A0A8T0FY68_ARGBR|nr:protein masquerade-like [Argiope bruennichi]KAF8796054.1 Protein masquerade like protein [Argiope bruennichi]